MSWTEANAREYLDLEVGRWRPENHAARCAGLALIAALDTERELLRRYRAEYSELRKQLDKAKESLSTIACSGSDCAPGDGPEYFYRSQMIRTIATAARALAGLPDE